MIGNTWVAAPYAEVSGARVDYTDQPKPNLIDRSADDYHAKAGLRFNVSPQFTADTGWRANLRDTDDRRITSYSSTYFDGALTWRPSPFFTLTGAIERYIGEPSTYIGILADVRSYSVKASYVPVPGVTFNLGAGWQIVSDVGSGSHYETPTADLQAIWDYNSHVQFYTTLHYQGYNLDGQNLGYSEYAGAERGAHRAGRPGHPAGREPRKPVRPPCRCSIGPSARSCPCRADIPGSVCPE